MGLKKDEKYLDVCKFFETVIIKCSEQLQVNCCGTFEFCDFDQGFSNNSDENQNHIFNIMRKKKTKGKEENYP
jgi:hypothetical protein